MFSRICLPTPTVSSAKYSVTSAPMTLAGTLTLSAVNTYGSEFGSRSLMNVTFVTGDAEKDAAFVKAAAAQGLVNLKGHRTVGGMRASIYNAMPMEGVKKLVEFMKEFERANA